MPTSSSPEVVRRAPRSRHAFTAPNPKDAHDRYANQEVAYLLQRIELFDGVSILASNLRENLDEAFTRRFESVVYFPLPLPRIIETLTAGSRPQRVLRARSGIPRETTSPTERQPSRDPYPR